MSGAESDGREPWREGPSGPEPPYAAETLGSAAHGTVARDLFWPGAAPMGWFRFYFDGQRWEWSPQVAQLHGYKSGEVIPTTELVLSHKHPEDRGMIAGMIDAITHTRGALSSRHRIIDTSGAIHWVVVIGDQFFDNTGAVVGTHGFYVDVTPRERIHADVERRQEELVRARVAEITDSRASIEQVKGMLMLVYDVDEDVAFRVLTWLSQQHNVKVRSLAERLNVDLRGVKKFDRSAFDHVLLTAHERLHTSAD